jgi:hypothetical protein
MPEKKNVTNVPKPSSEKKKRGGGGGSAPAKKPEPKKPKRSVGRPKKKIDRRTIKMEGVVSQPSNSETAKEEALLYSMELLYANPLMFKNIFVLLKHMKVTHIYARFEKDCVKFYSSSQSEINRIYIKVFGDKMNRYYCRKTLEVEFDIQNWLNRLKTLSKENTEIFFNTTRNDENRGLYMVMRDETLEINYEDTIYINIPERSGIEQIEKELGLEDDYSIKFELSFKKFKEIIANTSQLVDYFEIEKAGSENLTFKYPYRDDLGKHDTTFENPKKIYLKSKVPEGSIFSVQVDVARVKLLSGASVAESVQVAVDEGRDLIFTIYLDREYTDDKKIVAGSECACVKVMTKLKGKK